MPENPQAKRIFVFAISLPNLLRFNHDFSVGLSDLKGEWIGLEDDDLHSLLYFHPKLIDLPPGSHAVRCKKGLHTWAIIFSAPTDCIDAFIASKTARLIELEGELILVESDAPGGKFATHCPEIFNASQPVQNETRIPFYHPDSSFIDSFLFLLGALSILVQFPLKRVRSATRYFVHRIKCTRFHP